MKIETFYFNPYRECTYVLTELGDAYADSDCIVIDAGMYSDSEQQRFDTWIRDHHLSIRHLLITHSHPDHICGVEWMQQTYGITPENTVPLGCERIPTPGHHPDCVCYYWKKEGILFTGDTLFYESIGRTDLPGGDIGLLMKSLQQIALLPPSTIIYPGHGISTTLSHELSYNPYL